MNAAVVDRPLWLEQVSARWREAPADASLRDATSMFDVDTTAVALDPSRG